ncbi:transmembrane protein 171 isoform X2 [Hippopotamus amphibius kiboko]|uniref:transmembrane protein 171 isoform X2 n=1 Tax=Hippopotamus amphibius kiboko TaxID=575201 RepID=UPI002591D187|nr:transmembrane protein 171 isoform X2 [Hippopotamus amphibius kiboko]
MSPAAAAEPDEVQGDRHVSKLIFFLFVIGAILLCVGVLLSIFGFQACQYETLPECNMVLKIAGPACAVIGLGAVILARSRARLQQSEERLQGNLGDSDRAFLCGESRQFVQCLIFGFLFLTSGMLISVLGIWVPGCGSDWVQEPLNETDSADAEPQICGFLSLQILGPLIVLVGLCFFVVAHVKKRNNLNGGQDASEDEERQTQTLEPVQVTVGPQLLRAKAQPLREIMTLSILFLGLLHPLRPHTLLISHPNCLPDTKKKNLLPPRPCLHLLSLLLPEPWTPVQFYME